MSPRDCPSEKESFVLYSDFNCPFCYALHERLHDMGLLNQVSWRGVQHAPHLPKPMKSWQGSLWTELRREVAMVQRLCPDLPISLPSGKPNTKRAIELAASQLQQDRERGMQVVRDLYRAFWCEGKDLSSQLVLDEFGLADGSDLDRIGERWNEDWQASGQTGVPLLVAPNGEMLVGCVPVGDIRRFMNRR